MNEQVQKYDEEVKKLSEQYVKILDVLKLLEPIQLASNINYNIPNINGLTSKHVARYVHGRIRFKLIGK